MTRLRKTRHPTVNDFTWSVVEEFKKSIQFVKASKSGKKNRIAGGDRCKQYGGSQSAIDLATQELRATGKHINPVKMYGIYHPEKRKNGELITCPSQNVVKDALSKLYNACQDDFQQQSQPSSQEESSTTPKISSTKLSSKYLEVVGCKKMRVGGLGSYSEAFLHHVNESSTERLSSRARRMREFCVYWDARMREVLISEGDEAPQLCQL
ncbi:unnamed protein product [Cuscuta europaea]|uniref:Uncharacterized protein n=1 Tax=Cuscuta europaea TaxID=41803 RepID=A0A9P1E8X7_CUSEU|nr:unnamed protein product [Cuscuta europaea]